ncbi:MAG: hypothetical protein NTU44_01435 [Bacteroidetes bacterium]|nr:hypothetical protein [Bacteroidota bacterium]
MKTKLRFLQWFMVLIFSAGTTAIMAQGPYPNTGNDAVCLNSTHNYGVINTTTSTYAWTITLASGGTINVTANNKISVLWETTGTYTLDVIETNLAGCSFQIASIQVVVNPLPIPALTGPSPVCMSSTGNVYSTDAGMTNYVWSIAGGVITSGGTTETPTVSWNGTGPYSISVNYNDANGCTAALSVNLPVTVNSLPTTSPIYHD